MVVPIIRIVKYVVVYIRVPYLGKLAWIIVKLKPVYASAAMIFLS